MKGYFMSKTIKLLLYCITLLLVAGQAQAVSSQETPQLAVEAGNLIEGTVVETMNVGGYTYVCIENNGQTSWAATRGATVEVGEEVEIARGSVMTDFTSESLGRTFDTIIFTNRIVKR
jgi:hypothetical protein